MAEAVFDGQASGGVAIQTLRGLRVDLFCDSPRFRDLDKSDAYFAARQYEHLRYDWNGNYQGYGDSADIAPGWFVPLRQRKPAIRINLPRYIVRKLTAMLLGEDRWPELTVDGDEDAEDFAKTLIDESNLRIKLEEARDMGGMCGTAVASFAFVEGKPRVQVHRAKHIYVLRWADRYEFRPAEVLKVYRYTKREINKEGKPVEVVYYFARYWSETVEVVWDPIPQEVAKTGQWADVVKSYLVQHDYGECPVYWCQNLPDSENEDGLSDYDGLLDEVDGINRLLSATHKGTVANVDPTLVIKDEPTSNEGNIRKGSENAIFSPGGAEYLELKGDSVKTALMLTDKLVRWVLEVAQVVSGDPDKLSGAAKSAAALRVLYQPMINQCDKYRSQYGRGLLIPLLQGMLRAAKRIGSQAAGPVLVTADGRRIQERPVLTLPPRLETVSRESADGESTEVQRTVERNPGQSERIQLKWPPYFRPGLAEVNQATDAALKAQGKLVSDKTATKFIAPMFGVEDISAELDQLEDDHYAKAARYPGPGDEMFSHPKGEPKEPEEPEEGEE